MHPQTRLLSLLVINCLLFAPLLRAQGTDSEIAKMMKEAQEMQKQTNELNKKYPPASKEKLAELAAQSQRMAAEAEAKEKRDQEKLQAALKKQLEEPGPVVLPDWTPATPQFKAAGAPTRKIVDDEVRIIQTGTSSLTPKELADGWEAAADAAKNLNHVRNNISSNGNLTTIMFLSTRTDPVQKVEMEARREAGGKMTQIEIFSPLPKPDIESE
jgi:fatty acid-binding protein DegV